MHSRPTRAFLLTAALLLALRGATHATVKPNSLISDGAVLQQGQPIPLWGTAAEGEKVTVKFQTQEVSTTAKEGRWLVKLKPVKAGGPFTLTISGTNTIEVKDLLVGEVWICSGELNMDWPLKKSANGPAAAEAAADPGLRLCRVPPVVSAPTGTPLTDVAVQWTPCSPATAGTFSGVGYFFGRDLRKALKVPVGLIQAAACGVGDGGTALEAWLQPGVYNTDPKLRPLLDNPKLSGLYNQMIAPLQPYGIRGVIWYQGETDSGNAMQYRRLFPALIRGWRETWQAGNFPFLFVQLAPCLRWPPGMRESQLLTWPKTSNTAMVVTTDLGETDPDSLTPLRKEPVGAPRALPARAVAYGEKIEYSGPLYQSVKLENRRAVLTFTHVGQGLEARGGPLKGFTIAGADDQFVKTTAKIEGATVVVSCPGILKPAAVRYGWDGVPEANLFNKDGLPASPFRTDVQ